MATLQVTNLKNIAAGANTNVSLLADGTTTLVLNATGTSRTGGIRYNAGNLEVYTSGGVWVAAGGGSGTVTGVTGTLPIVSTGGTAPVLSINAATNATAGSMSAADKAKLDGAATIVSAVTGTLPITVATGTSTPVIAINAATTALPGSVQLADGAASKAGTSATLVNTPAFSVPKDAANMTGAAILPSGTDAQRAAISSPVAGMTRFNTTQNSMEFYDGTNWRGPYEFVQSAGWFGGSPGAIAQQFVPPSTDATFTLEPITLTPGTWLISLNFYAQCDPNTPSGTYGLNVIFPYATVGGYSNPNLVWVSKPDGPQFRTISVNNSPYELDTVIAVKVGPGNLTISQLVGNWSNTGSSDNSNHDLKVNAWFTAMRID